MFLIYSRLKNRFSFEMHVSLPYLLPPNCSTISGNRHRFKGECSTVEMASLFATIRLRVLVSLPFKRGIFSVPLKKRVWVGQRLRSKRQTFVIYFGSVVLKVFNSASFHNDVYNPTISNVRKCLFFPPYWKMEKKLSPFFFFLYVASH